MKYIIFLCKSNMFSSAVGVDVSSQTLDVCLKDATRIHLQKTFENSTSGIQELISVLGENQFSGIIVIESTGRYHALCSVLLKDAGYTVSVINPLITKRYQQSYIRKLKTDSYDAQLLAEVGLREKNLPLFTDTHTTIALKAKIGMVASLETKLQELNAMLKNNKKILSEQNEDLGFFQSLESAIKAIDKEKESMEQHIIQKVFDIKGKESQNVLTSIPGVSDYYAALIALYYDANNHSASEWVAFSGLEVSISQSGTWTGKGRLSKRGNRYLRKRNYSAGWGAWMGNPEFKQYYNKLKDQGREYREIILIIGRKILRISHACLKNMTLYDPKLAWNN